MQVIGSPRSYVTAVCMAGIFWDPRVTSFSPGKMDAWNL